MDRKQRISYLPIEAMDHEVLAGTDASMAPGFGTPEELAASKSSGDYWARTPGSAAEPG